jgi:hypothetical protein
VRDTAIVRLPIWMFQSTIGRVFSKREVEEVEYEELVDEIVDDESSEPGKRTPSTDSAEEFEMLEKSTDDLDTDKAKVSGSSQKAAKAAKRKVKKR